MTLYCVLSPGGAPGATTVAVGLSLTWPGKVLLAECDPAGRRVLPGFMADRLTRPPGPGLLGWVMAVQGDPQAAAAALEEYTLPLTDGGGARLLHGVHDPRHVRQLAQAWRPVVEALTAGGGDVVADVGRVGGPETPVELLESADVVLVVLRPTLSQVDAAQPRMEVLREVVGEHARLGLCLVNNGSYGAADVQRVLGVPVWAELPHAVNDARVLSDGAAPRLTFKTSLLMRGLDALGRRLRETAQEGLAAPDADLAAAGGGR